MVGIFRLNRVSAEAGPGPVWALAKAWMPMPHMESPVIGVPADEPQDEIVESV